jgi:hypothetical protein
MLNLKKNDLVIKHWEDLTIMGYFQEYCRTSRGHLVALFLTPEGFVFGSDPSHLERVNAEAVTSAERVSYRSQVATV